MKEQQRSRITRSSASLTALASRTSLAVCLLVVTGCAARSGAQDHGQAPVSAPQLEPDGNDETPASDTELPARGHFEKVGRHWAALQRVCDLAVLAAIPAA